MRLLVSSTPKILPSLLPEFSPWLGTLVTPRNGALPQARRLWAAHRMPWAADNDAFGDFDAAAYRAMLARIAGEGGCLWVSVPDMVGNACGTLHLWHQWACEVEEVAQQPLALVGQDGMEDREIPWGEFDALFLGGSTEWKLSRHAASLAHEAVVRGKHVHMGRCNSARRYRKAQAMGCETVDGTNVCLFPDRWLPVMARALDRQEADQPTLFGI